jgi:hypothetical protein
MKRIEITKGEIIVWSFTLLILVVIGFTWYKIIRNNPPDRYFEEFVVRSNN